MSIIGVVPTCEIVDLCKKLFEFNTSVLLWSFLRHFSFRPHLDSYGYQVSRLKFPFGGTGAGVPQLAQKRPITNSKSQIQTASKLDFTTL
jgi:hypothetical protein